MKKEEYGILNVLRGLSAFAVLFFHFCYFFFSAPYTSASYFKIEPVFLPDPFYVKAIHESPLHFQPLVVCSFFLMSGFLIVPSLARYDSFKTYVVHKFLRLWPTYAVCFGTGLLFVVAFTWLQDLPFPYSLGDVLAYFSWSRDIFDDPFIDGSVWTLEIQIKFYLLAGIVWYTGRKHFIEKLCFWTLALSFLSYGLWMLGLSILTEGMDLPLWLHVAILAREELQIIVFIVLGVCLYGLHKKLISWKKTAFLCTILIACFSTFLVTPFLSRVLNEPIQPLFDRLKQVELIYGYLFGFVVFSAIVLFDMHVSRLSPRGIIGKVINWLSQISYPLYVGHMLPGFIMMFFAVDNGVNVWWGIAAAYVYSLGMATFVHKKVELFFVRVSKNMIAAQNDKP